MKLLDKYILIKFIFPFLFITATLTVILLLLDYSNNHDKFLKTGLPATTIIFRYFIHLIPYIIITITPIVAFLAAVYCTTQLVAHSEIKAMVGSGISYKRFLMPFVLSSCFMALTIFYLSGWVIPDSNKIRIDFENKFLNPKIFFADKNVHIQVNPNKFVYLQSFDDQQKTGTEFTLEEIAGTSLLYKLKAKKITWIPVKRCWRIDNYSIRTFKDSEESFISGISKDTNINISPLDFKKNYYLHHTLYTSELDEYIQKIKMKGVENTHLLLFEKYERISYPFSIIFLTVLGVIISIKPNFTHKWITISIGLLIAFLFFTAVLISKTFIEAESLHPLVAVAIPYSILLLIFLLWVFLKKEH